MRWAKSELNPSPLQGGRELRLCLDPRVDRIYRDREHLGDALFAQTEAGHVLRLIGVGNAVLDLL